MDVRHLELLRELAQRGSVTAVAAATFRTPSAVSQQLKTAERAFGVPLVQPSGRGLELTAAGRLLAEGGAEVATAVARVEAKWDAFRGEPAGTVSVAAFPSAAAFLFPGLLRTLRDSRITVECTDTDTAEADFAGLTADFDVVLAHSLNRSRPARSEGLIVVDIAQEPLDVALPADHPLTERESLTAEDLVELQWIGVPAGYPFDRVLHSVAQVTGRELNIGQKLKDNRLMEALVGSGDFAAILPRFTTAPTGGFTLRPLAGLNAVRSVSALLRPDRMERLAVQRVVAVLEHEGRDAEERHRRVL
jgi:DNA-binding transcriptional LysR family regulator